MLDGVRIMSVSESIDVSSEREFALVDEGATAPRLPFFTMLPIDELRHLLSLCSNRMLLLLAQVSKALHHEISVNAALAPYLNHWGGTSALVALRKHMQAATFDPVGINGFQLSRGNRCAARVSPMGYLRIRGKVALPRGCAFAMRLCPLDGFRDAMYLMQVGVEWQGEATVWGPTIVDEGSICTDPSTPLVGRGPIHMASDVGTNAYGPGRYKIGDVVRVTFAANGAVSFAVNGKDYGVAFTTPALQVWPFARLYLPNSIEFVGEIEYI